MGQIKEVKYYTDEEKRAIIEEYLTSGESAKSIQKKYGLYGHSKIRDWMNKFGMRVKVTIRETRIASNTRDRIYFAPVEMSKDTELEKRVKQLEQELENERLRVMLLDKIIEIAERDLKISIRKKSGAKQSKK